MNSRLGFCNRLGLPALFTLLAIVALCVAPISWAAVSPSSTSLTVPSAGNPTSSVMAGMVVTLTQMNAATTHAPVALGQVKFCDAAALAVKTLPFSRPRS